MREWKITHSNEHLSRLKVSKTLCWPLHGHFLQWNWTHTQLSLQSKGRRNEERYSGYSKQMKRCIQRCKSDTYQRWGTSLQVHFASVLHFTADKCTPQIPSCPREVSEAQFRRTKDHGRDFVLATQGFRYKNEWFCRVPYFRCRGFFFNHCRFEIKQKENLRNTKAPVRGFESNITQTESQQRPFYELDNPQSISAGYKSYKVIISPLQRKTSHFYSKDSWWMLLL